MLSIPEVGTQKNMQEEQRGKPLNDAPVFETIQVHRVGSRSLHFALFWEVILLEYKSLITEIKSVGAKTPLEQGDLLPTERAIVFAVNK